MQHLTKNRRKKKIEKEENNKFCLLSDKNEIIIRIINCNMNSEQMGLVLSQKRS